MKKLTTSKALVMGVLSVLMITVLAGFVADAYNTDTPAAGKASTAQAVIGMEKAKALALAHLGLREATFTQQEYDQEDGVYELDLISGSTRYEFEVNAFTGKVVEVERERIPAQGSSQNDALDDRYDDLDDRYDDLDDRYDDLDDHDDDWDDRYDNLDDRDDDRDDRYDDLDDRYDDLDDHDDDWDDRYDDLDDHDDDWDDRYDDLDDHDDDWDDRYDHDDDWDDRYDDLDDRGSHYDL